MCKTLLSTSLALILSFGLFASNGADHFKITITDGVSTSLHNIDVDIEEEQGTAILSTDSGKILDYQVYSASHAHLCFHDLKSGKYKLCFKGNGSTKWKTVTIP